MRGGEMRPNNQVVYMDTAADVVLRQQGKDKFSVRYCSHFKEDLNYAEAAAELGACLMHAAACNGRLTQ